MLNIKLLYCSGCYLPHAQSDIQKIYIMVLVELFFGTLLWSSYTNEHKSKRFGVLLVIWVSCCSSFLCFKHYVQQSSFLKFVPVITFFVVALTHPRFYSNCGIIFYRGKFWLNCIQPSCKSTCS